MSALVCGLWDEASGIGAVGWRVGDAAGGLLASGEGVAPARAEIGEEGDGVRLVLEAKGRTLAAELSPRGGELALAAPNGGPPPEGEPAAAICVAAVVFGEGGEQRRLAGLGHLTRWRGDLGPGTLRHLAVPASGGGLLVFSGGGEGPHGAESAAAWMLAGEGGEARPFGEALLSTQYDAVGRPTRAGLELWPADEGPPLRAAGDAIGVAAEGAVRAALMRTSSEGTEGVGSYVLRRQ